MKQKLQQIASDLERINRDLHSESEVWNANKYYEKHPLLGAADRATLYAFVARKQPHE